jgi:hypothetical protein
MGDQPMTASMFTGHDLALVSLYVGGCAITIVLVVVGFAATVGGIGWASDTYHANPWARAASAVGGPLLGLTLAILLAFFWTSYSNWTQTPDGACWSASSAHQAEACRETPR